MIQPDQIPQFTGNLAQLEKDYAGLKKDAGNIRGAGSDVHSQFQGLSAYYRAPEAEQLFATTKPVKDKADAFADDLETVSSALSSYATEVRPLVEKLKELKTRAQTFVDSVKDDDEWQYNGDKVEEHNGIRDEITATVAAFWAAERACHNKITALWGGTQMVAGDGSDRKDQYGFSAEDMKNAKLPWGDPVEEKHHWYEVGHWVKSFVWDGLIVDGVWGTIKGLGTLVGFGGWEAMGQAWKGLAQLATGLALSSIPGVGAMFWSLPDNKLPGWIRDSRTAMKETGKALVAWDQWGKNPARAAGAVTFNVVTTVFTGGAGAAASGAGKAGAVSKALSVAGKAGRVIDPMTYIAKGAGAGLSKIGDIATSLKGVGTIDIPTLPDGSVQLPDGRTLAPNGNIVAPNGVIDATPIRHETTPTVPHGTTAPTLPDHWTIPQGQQPVYAGVHAGDGGVHTVDNAANAGHSNQPGVNTPVGGHVPGGSLDATPTQTPYGHTPGGHVPGPGAYDNVPGPGAYDNVPGPSAYDNGTPPHTGGHDAPGSGGYDAPGGYTDDAAHGADDAAHAGDDAAHGADDASHAGDDAAHVGDTATDAAAHHGTDVPDAPGHQGTDVPGGGAADEPFEYKPQMSHADFMRLSDEEKHAVAAAELAEGTLPFADDTAAIAYGRDYWNDYVDNLDPSARQALNDYTGEGFPSYKDMNGYLRGTGGYGPDPATLHAIDEVDRVLSSRPVPDNIMVVRGTGLDHLNLDSPADMLGNTYPDKGYTSTSLGNHPVDGFKDKPAILHLRVPKGTPALWLEKVSQFDVKERELLLARGTEFKVTRVFMDEAGKWQVYGEVLPRH
ncbi:ADP-ribosyltransferase [Streptomyces sp. NPDC051207]|uniref:ADP-ribosyltransferase n=1 Tax=Streptomyces sp. NPDC051207 TaxID=3154641 RepID=UPI00342504AB